MKQVPFYQNHEDNMHCMLAVYAPIIDYFLHRQLTWQELEALTGFKDGVAVWTVSVLPKMIALGFDIRMVEDFDYRSYLHKGPEYLEDRYKPEEIEWYNQHSNIVGMRQQIPEFLRTIDYQQRSPDLDDIDEMLAEDRLIFATVDNSILNKTKKYSPHAILIIEKSGSDYVVHDPGRPGNPYRKISEELLWHALGGTNNKAEVTGFKLSTTKIRADVLVTQLYPAYSRSTLAKLFDKGLIKNGDKILRAGDKLMPGILIDVDTTSLVQQAVKTDLPILYEDDDVIVLNKPAGMLTHAKGVISSEPTVAEFMRPRSTADMVTNRPGIVHRLDRGTSGVIIAAKHDEAKRWLQKQFAERKVKKTYLALIAGVPKQPHAIIDAPIERNPKQPQTFRVGGGGKPAQTEYEVAERLSGHTLLRLSPRTGRTHQLRVHMRYIDRPIVGDELYGSSEPALGRLFLHASQLELTLPNHERRTFTAPLAPELEDYLVRLRAGVQ